MLFSISGESPTEPPLGPNGLHSVTACWPFASPAVPGRLTPIRHRASTNPPQGERHMCLLPSRPAVAPLVDLKLWPLARGRPTRLDELLDLILPAFPPAARARLRQAGAADRLIRFAYFDDKGGACLLHALHPGIRSRADRIRYFAANAILLEASEEMVIGWDSGQITSAMVKGALRRAAAEQDA